MGPCGFNDRPERTLPREGCPFPFLCGSDFEPGLASLGQAAWLGQAEPVLALSWTILAWPQHAMSEGVPKGGDLDKITNEKVPCIYYIIYILHNIHIT